MLLMNETSDLLTDFINGLISARVQYFATGAEPDGDEDGTTQIQFSLGIDQPTVYIEVLTPVAQALVEAEAPDRNKVFTYIMNRFAEAGVPN